MAKIAKAEQLEARSVVYMSMAGDLYRKKWRKEPTFEELLRISTLLAQIDTGMQIVSAIEEMADRLPP